MIQTVQVARSDLSVRHPQQAMLGGRTASMITAQDPIVGFYRGIYTDDRGRDLEAILAHDDTWLEATHDFIQWLFPLAEGSRVNAEAPLVTENTVNAFQGEETLRSRLLASYARMLAFYGLQRSPDSTVQKAASWPTRKRIWFTRDTHNSLRITRILKCLTLLGLDRDARAFHAAFAALCATEMGCGIHAMSRAYWRSAIHAGRACRTAG